ncbi:MAG: 3'-5' exonuclease, partial [Pseudomonadota bacterium]
ISPHEAKRDTQNGRVELWPLVMPEETPADSSWDVPVDHIAPTDPSRQLANKIADQIVLMLQNGDAVWHEGPGRNWTQRPMTAGDVLILVRRRSAIFKMLIGALESRNLPVAGADRLWLNESLAVQDCLNLIRFTLQPGDDLTLAEILRGPFCNLVEDDRHLFTLAHNRQPGETLWSRLDQAPTQPLQAARAFCHELLSLRHSGPFSFLSQVLDRSLIGNGTGWAQLIKRFGEPARNPIEELVSRALKQEQSESVSLQKFLSTLDTEQIELKRELGEAGDTIRVMTVHGAKGLQSPIVILPDTTNRTRKTQTILFFTETGRPLFSPSAAQDCAATALLRAAENDAQEKESRRLLYVALTRAQDRLIICGAGTKRPQSGFDNSSWYRWCLRGMGQAIRASVFEEAQEEILSIGKPIAQLGRAHLQDERQNELPAWLNHKTFTDAFAPKKTIAPSRLSFTHSETKLEISQARRFAMHRGEIIHTLLQLVPELPSLRWRSEVRAYLDQTPDLTDDQRTEILTVTMATLADPEISNLLSRSGRSEVPISGHLPNGDPISGRIDRLCISAESILILDYKTDRPAPAGVSEIGQDYTLQLAAYSHIVKELYPSRSVSAALLYTEGPKLFRFGADELSVSLNRYANTV